jgi:hypothetical protein
VMSFRAVNPGEDHRITPMPVERADPPH